MYEVWIGAGLMSWPTERFADPIIGDVIVFTYRGVFISVRIGKVKYSYGWDDVKSFVDHRIRLRDE